MNLRPLAHGGGLRCSASGEFAVYGIRGGRNLPVPELVKVARSPWDYLPEAVSAAELVLKERGITAEEIAAEEWALAQKEMLADAR